MATSLRDLLDAADAEFRGDQVGLGEAAAALARTARLLDLMLAYRSDAKHSRTRHERIRSLAGPCERAAGAWPNEPGRASELLGVAADAVGVFRDQLSGDDRWALTLRTASIARRAASVISSAGPYDKAPTLRLTIAAADELRRMGANNPPNPDRFRSIDSPIPLSAPSRSATASSALEYAAKLVYELNRPEQPPLPLAELIVSSRAGEAIAYALADRLPAEPASVRQMADPAAWTTLRETLARFTDGRGRPVPDAVFEAAIGLCRSLVQVTGRADGAFTATASELASLLPRLAEGIEVQWRHIDRSLFVSPGLAPLSEATVGEWLMRKTFIAGPAERAAVLEALQSVASTRATFALTTYTGRPLIPELDGRAPGLY